MKKLEPIKGEDFRTIQNYFHDKSIENGRMAFKIRTQMLEDIPANFKNKYRNNKEKLKCEDCDANELMSQSHCVSCTAWSDVRKDLDLTSIDDMVIFFRRLLSERSKDKSKV